MSRKKEKKKPQPTKRCGACEYRKDGKCKGGRNLTVSRNHPACADFSKKVKASNPAS